MFGDTILDEVLDMIRQLISTNTFYDTKVLIERDDKLSNDITFGNVMTITSCMIKT